MKDKLAKKVMMLLPTSVKLLEITIQINATVINLALTYKTISNSSLMINAMERVGVTLKSEETYFLLKSVNLKLYSQEKSILQTMS